MTPRFARHIVATFVVMASLLCVAEPVSASVVRICNETGETMWLAKAFRWRDSTITWRTVGWDRVEAGGCWRADIGYADRDGIGRWFFAFVTETRNPVFKPSDASGVLPFERMCVGPDVSERFVFDRGPEGQNVGENCSGEATLVRVSFGVAGGDNDVQLTLR